MLVNEKNEYRKKEFFDLRENFAKNRTDTFMQVSAYANSATDELKTIFEPFYDNVLSNAKKLFDPVHSGPLYIPMQQTNRTLGVEMTKSIAIKVPQGSQEMSASKLLSTIPMVNSQMVTSNRLGAPPYPMQVTYLESNPPSARGLSPTFGADYGNGNRVQRW